MDNTKLSNMNLSKKWRNEKKLRKEDNAMRDNQIKELELQVKQLNDINGALQSENGDLLKELNQRTDQDSLIVCTNGYYITHITKTLAYNERVAFQELQGINLLKICKTPLYRKIPFIQLNNGQLEINQKQYKKYKGGII